MRGSEDKLWTPGPWVDDRKDHDQPYLPIKIKGKSRTICSVWMDDAPVHDFNAEQRANADLIAASPTLYDALSNLLDAIYSGASPTDAIDAAEDALAKARGEG